MRLDNKGDIGFPEAMMALMMVIIVLSAFLAFFVFNVVQASEEAPENDDFFDTIVIRNGTIEDDFQEYMEDYCLANDCSGMNIRITVPGEILNIEGEYSYGSMDGSLGGARYLRTVQIEDGRLIPMIFEVAVCH